MITISIVIYIIATGVFYFALVYNNTFFPNAAKKMREEENDYLQRYRRHRG